MQEPECSEAVLHLPERVQGLIVIQVLERCRSVTWLSSDACTLAHLCKTSIGCHKVSFRDVFLQPTLECRSSGLPQHGGEHQSSLGSTCPASRRQ